MALVVKDLQKTYHHRRVVDGVSLEVHPGEVVGLLGPNGAGKTTSFYMIVGLERSENGAINLDGTEITRMPMYKRAGLGMSYLPQEPSIFRQMTVEDNLGSILEVMGLTRKQRKEKVNELLQEFSLTHVRKHRGGYLSGGERRRTEIARALALSPQYLLLDEPFTGVDPIAVSEIQGIVAHLRGKGIGILITDHSVRETLAITDRAYIMYQGKILVSGPAGEISDNPIARKFYLGEGFSM